MRSQQVCTEQPSFSISWMLVQNFVVLENSKELVRHFLKVSIIPLFIPIIPFNIPFRKKNIGRNRKGLSLK